MVDGGWRAQHTLLVVQVADGEALPLEGDMCHTLLVADAGVKTTVLLGVERGMGHRLMCHGVGHDNILGAESVK